jgi:hypothetical protein
LSIKAAEWPRACEQRPRTVVRSWLAIVATAFTIP